MKTKQPTFVERIQLLEEVARELAAVSFDDFSIHEVRMFNGHAVIISEEVERMKEANKRFEAQRAEKAKRKAKTASKETAITR